MKLSQLDLLTDKTQQHAAGVTDENSGTGAICGELCGLVEDGEDGEDTFDDEWFTEEDFAEALTLLSKAYKALRTTVDRVSMSPGRARALDNFADDIGHFVSLFLQTGE